MVVPSICTNSACGKVWFTRSPIRQIEFYNTLLGSCPACGSAKYVPDGRYSALGATLLQREDLRKVVAALRELQAMASRGASRSEIDDAISRKHPSLEPLKKHLPRDPKALLMHIGPAVTVLAALLETCSGPKGPTVIEQHNYYIQSELHELLTPPPAPSAPEPTDPSTRSGPRQ
jgi:hypothetical protein